MHGGGALPGQSGSVYFHVGSMAKEEGRMQERPWTIPEPRHTELGRWKLFHARLAYSLEPFSTEVVYPMKGDHFRITVSIKSADVPKLTTELMSQDYHH